MIYYTISIGILLVCAIISGVASIKVNSAYAKYAQVKTNSHMTGYDTARRLLNVNGIIDISVERVNGKLTDHYNPSENVVNLSETTYGDDSVAAVAVAAHEIGHVMQKKEGYLPYKIRTILVPITNIGSRLALPLVLVGLLLDLFIYDINNPFGWYLALIGVVCYGLSTIFMLATLPVEFDASRRAKKMLVEENILSVDEKRGAQKVLKAAAMTYVASLMVSLLYFLRFLLWVLMLFGGGKRRR